ncbi:MAG: hypothetical protein ACTTH7_09765 [Treponema sp.]
MGYSTCSIGNGDVITSGNDIPVRSEGNHCHPIRLVKLLRMAKLW